MNKKLKSYETPAASIVAVSVGNIICQGSPLSVFVTTDILNSGSGNPLEDMDYHNVVDESF